MPGLRLDARNLKFRVRRLEILKGVSFSCLAGEFVGVLGPSGCGKSTLLKTLAGLQQPSEGEVLYDTVAPESRHTKQVGYVPQDDIVHLGLTVEKALLYSAKLRMRSDLEASAYQKAVDEVIEQLDLGERRRLRIAKLSGGQRKRVNIGVELLTRPNLLFLDEPTSGLDPALEDKFMQQCAQLAAGGRTMVMTTHILQNLELFDLVLILSAGHLVYAGPPGEAAAYFGLKSPQDIYRHLPAEKAAQQAGQFERSSYHVSYVRERQSILTPPEN